MKTFIAMTALAVLGAFIGSPGSAAELKSRHAVVVPVPVPAPAPNWSGYYGAGWSGYYDGGWRWSSRVELENFCAARFRSFDRASGTYLGTDGFRHSCLPVEAFAQDWGGSYGGAWSGYTDYSDDGWHGVGGYYAGPVEAAAIEGYCAGRFRSYDPVSGTYLGRDGRRHPCG